MNEILIYNSSLSKPTRGKSTKKNKGRVGSVYRARKQTNDVYQKAVEEYEQYKKQNPHGSALDSSENDIYCKNSKDDSRIKAINGNNLSNAGKSVVGYKKLVNNFKSPYMNQATIDNLTKAYYPGKIRRRQLARRKKKSCTPNLKYRRGHNSSEIPKVFQYPETQEQIEINQLRTKRELEEQQIIERQKQNIEKLKKLQNQVSQPQIIVEDQESEQAVAVTKVKPVKKDLIDDLNMKMQLEIQEKAKAYQNDPSLQDKVYNGQAIRSENFKVLEATSHETIKQTPLDKNIGLQKAILEKSDSAVLDNIVEKPVQTNGTKKRGVSKSKSKKAVPKTIKRVFPNCQDLKSWKKRNRLTHKTKIFKIVGGYTTIKDTLHEKGWVENKDKNSVCFDLLWTTKQRDIKFEDLKDGQVVNHFKNNAAITTKIGLCRNIGKVLNFSSVDVDTFFPKCFCLKDDDDWKEFSTYYKVCKAEGILKKFLKNEQVDPDMLDVAMTVCRRNLLELDDIIDKPFKDLVSDEEWKVLRKGEKRIKNFKRDKKISSLLPAKRSKLHQSPKGVSNILNSKKDASYKSPSIVTLKLPELENKKFASTTKGEKGFFIDSYTKNDVIRSMIETQGPSTSFIQKETSEKQDMLPKRLAQPKGSSHMTLRSDIESICDRLKQKFPQYHINGDKNIWIIKPAGLSRGRGIQVFSNFDEITDYTCDKEKGWIAQKYIENPMIVNQRKFDLRIWVFVSDLNPLTIWFWNKPYIRFPAADYNANNLKDRFVHLTNNSVGKYAKNFEVIGDGNMWHIEQLITHLQEKHGRDIWNEEIKPKIKDIIIHSLQSVQDLLDTRKGSTEMLGYDIMIDENFTPWLIEVNSSPTMESSTKVTAHLVTNVMQSVVKIISDYILAPKGSSRTEIDTGDFELIYKGKKFVDKGLNLFGVNLCCEGTRVYS
ncbi:unnamed protein product [Moneuplotes crassus]|uniref:Uncharacterized protein n=2 Tax=Euplotes crassus TaxID=5936 RepID=A0AAD2D6T1_EUPCR|nr:unnamed protein product [Moneuplotes crassus]